MLQVKSIKIDDILDSASNGHYQIPKFQREFVWNNNQISTLVESALQGLPCGAIVTWENPNDLLKGEYHHVRLEEKESGKKKFITFPDKNIAHNQPHVVIDGLQRITAICVAFGGLRNKNATYRLGGKFYINLDAKQIPGSIVFKKLNQIKDNKLDEEKTWKSTGIFPLHSSLWPFTSPLSGSVINHWSGTILTLVGNNHHRQKRVIDIIKALGRPIMAEMPLESSHSLADIADSFELLNTQGTPVSMVDIIHSTLFEWFKSNKNQNWELRDWIDSISQDTMSFGWGREKKRQIILQFGVAIELISTSRKPPRSGTAFPENISNKDILNINEKHWFELDQNTSLLKECINKFQQCVLGHQFPEIDCPYPISASIYIALYWKLKKENVSWTEERLNQIFKAFFWSNSLSQRYETDSLGVPRDMSSIEELLLENINEGDDAWKLNADAWLDNNIKQDFPSKTDLLDQLLGKPSGAIKQALQLPVKYMPTKDIVSHNSNIQFPAISSIQMHHIFPRKWIKDNTNRQVFGTWHQDADKMKELTDCLVNKTPLIDSSNLSWSSKSPSTAINGFSQVGQKKGKKIWTERFITDDTYDALLADEAKNFLEFRAEELADWFIDQSKIDA